jgi:hypothetical protein
LILVVISIGIGVYLAKTKTTKELLLRQHVSILKLVRNCAEVHDFAEKALVARRSLLLLVGVRAPGLNYQKTLTVNYRNCVMLNAGRSY